MTEADLAEWEAWVAGRNDRRTAASVAAALEGTRPPAGIDIIESTLVLEVTCVDEVDGAQYRRVYRTVEAAKRGTASLGGVGSASANWRRR